MGVTCMGRGWNFSSRQTGCIRDQDQG